MRTKHVESCPFKTLILLVFVFALASIWGCAGMVQTGEMALKFDNPPTTDRVNSMALFTMRLENQVRPSYKPNLKGLLITSADPVHKCNYKVDKSIAPDDLPYEEYLITLFLSPGDYLIEDASGTANNLIFNGVFKFPVLASFSIPPDTPLLYCGHISMINRERKSGERRSGKVIPLPDQAASGMAGGTFDIVISDKSETDIPLLQQNLPWLRNKEIKTSIMTKQ